MVDRGANIDLVFRNGLKDYEVLPPQDIWEGITPVIKKRPFLTPVRLAASIAVLVSLGMTSLYLVTRIDSGINSPTITLSPDENLPYSPVESRNMAVETSVAVNDLPVTPAAVNEQGNSELMFPAGKFTLPEPGLYTSFTERRNSGSQRSGATAGRIDMGVYPVNPAGDKNISDSDLEIKDEYASVKETGRWSIGALVIPTYYSSFSLSSDDAAKDLIKAEEAAVSYSGGLSFAYKIGKRLSIQTGLYYSSIGQKVKGVDSYSGFNRYNDAKGSGMFTVVTSSGTITSGNRDIYLADNNTGSRVLSALSLDVFDPVKADLSYLSNSLHQDFSYLEIPVMMRYKLLDRSIDFNLSGGFSYNLLVNNTTYAVSGGEKYYIGNTGNLSPVTFSSSLGMGIEYSFSGRLSLNLEPTFRYYITPLGGLAGSAIHPYSFGVLSGISYRF